MNIKQKIKLVELINDEREIWKVALDAVPPMILTARSVAMRLFGMMSMMEVLGDDEETEGYLRDEWQKVDSAIMIAWHEERERGRIHASSLRKQAE